MFFGTRQSIKSKSRDSSYTIKCLDGIPLQKAEHSKYLAVWLDSELSYKHHISQVIKKLNFSVVTLQVQTLFSLLERNQHHNLFYPYLNMLTLFISVPLKLNTVNNRLARFVLGCSLSTHHCTMYESLNWPSLTSKIHQHWLQFLFKCIHCNYALYLKQLMVLFPSTYQLRHSSQ